MIVVKWFIVERDTFLTNWIKWFVPWIHRENWRSEKCGLSGVWNNISIEHLCVGSITRSVHWLGQTLAKLNNYYRMPTHSEGVICKKPMVYCCAFPICISIIASLHYWKVFISNCTVCQIITYWIVIILFLLSFWYQEKCVKWARPIRHLALSLKHR